jgi:cytochrome o ubiquinol oxidase operon protein cyoD
MSTLTKYIIGFVLSILFTLIAFGAVSYHLETGHVFPSHMVAVPVLVALAVVQLLVQLICFLHVGRRGEGWNIISLVFTAFVVLVLVGGSIWIMYHLDHVAMEERFNEIYGDGLISPQTHGD